ncbi:hypothetical protein AYO38_08190 [bacterium SCGC AG-212-C10]|nr:hypothetical protein AYO38_08190 [bacterium SCGC AG-212-C10]
MRLYTVDEARSLLPDVIPVLTALRDVFRQLRGMQSAVAAHARGALTDGALLADPWKEGGDEPDDMEERYHQQVSRLHEMGIEVKDPERGLIDFFHLREGQTVFLCYELGEDDIRFWHTLEGGFAGRRPLE